MINTKCRKVRADFLFLGAALKMYGLHQLLLHIFCKGDFIRSHGIGAVFTPNITEDAFQVICNQASEIFIFPNLRHF
jgi:hypothetical protein